MIGIVNYGAGNIFSLTAALDRADLRYGMIDHQADFEKYDHIIIPGVGHAGAAMQKLRTSGLAEVIPTLRKPVLGICVGMQLLTAFSEEGGVAMLGLFPVHTLHFRERITEKVPHMGWNAIQIEKDNPLFAGIADHTYFYFVHSFFIQHDADYTLASCHYGITYAASMGRANFYGVQFHPEKSGSMGERLLQNFAAL